MVYKKSLGLLLYAYVNPYMPKPTGHVNLGPQTSWRTTVSPQNLSQIMMHYAAFTSVVNTFSMLLTCDLQTRA